MSLAFLAVTALVVGACAWPPQDYGDHGPPPMLFEPLPAPGAYKLAEHLIAKATWPELHLDGTIAHYRHGPPTGPSGVTGDLQAEALGLANLSGQPQSISTLKWLCTLTFLPPSCRSDAHFDAGIP